MAADVPLTTALRWAKQLETHGLVERTPDEKDGRRFFLRISEEGYARMTAYLAGDRASWTADEILRQKVRLLIQNDVPEQRQRSAAG
jgi:DNA-binding MarR family transcriptional regulator